MGTPTTRLGGTNPGFSFSIRNSRSTGKEPASYFKGKQLSDYSSDLTMDALQVGDSAIYLCASSSITTGHRHPFMPTHPHISLCAAPTLSSSPSLLIIPL